MNKQKYQKIHWRGNELNYRIGEAQLKRCCTEQGQRILEIMRGSSDGTLKVLYYCICWMSHDITLREFLADYRLGFVTIYQARNEHGLSSIHNLITNAARRYNML